MAKSARSLRSVVTMPVAKPPPIPRAKEMASAAVPNCYLKVSSDLWLNAEAEIARDLFDNRIDGIHDRTAHHFFAQR